MIWKSILMLLLILNSSNAVAQRKIFGSKIYIVPVAGAKPGLASGYESTDFTVNFNQNGTGGVYLAFELSKNFTLKTGVNYSMKNYYVDYKDSFYDGYSFFENSLSGNSFDHKNVGGEFEIGLGYKWIYKRLVMMPFVSAKIPFSQNTNSEIFELKENGTNNVRRYDIRLDSKRQPIVARAGFDGLLHLGQHFGFLFSVGFEYENAETNLRVNRKDILYPAVSNNYHFIMKESGAFLSVGIFLGIGNSKIDRNL